MCGSMSITCYRKGGHFLQAYVASNLLHVFQLIFVFCFHALPYTKTKEKEKVTVMKI